MPSRLKVVHVGLGPIGQIIARLTLDDVVVVPTIDRVVAPAPEQ